MKPIRILSPQLELLAEIDDYEYLFFPRLWHGIGMFEIRINRYKQHVEHLQKRNFIMLGADTHKVGRILHKEIGLDANGKASESWIIKGLSAKGLLGQRITIPPSTTAYDNKQSNTETVMHHYVANNVTTPVDANRVIDLIQLASNQNRGPTVSWQSRYKNLAEELADISFVSGVGWNVTLDLVLQKFIFDVSVGRDLTVNQSVNPPVIFSPDFESIEDQSFSDSDLNYKNFGYIGGQGEGAARQIATIGNAIGADRIETFIDARDTEDTTQLSIRGQQKMKEFETELFLESRILTKSPYVYEQDYDLGDIVTTQNRGWGVTMDARITEINEIYEPGGFKLEAIFGQSRPTLLTKIKQEISQFGNEIRR